MNSKSTFVALVLCAGVAGSALAQGSGLKRELLHTTDLSAAGHEAVVARVEVAPGIMAGRHSHPGEEISYVLAGEGELLIDGEAPRKLKAGDSFVIPAGKIHDAKNTGSGPFKLFGVYVVEKGKPLASPAK